MCEMCRAITPHTGKGVHCTRGLQSGSCTLKPEHIPHSRSSYQ